MIQLGSSNRLFQQISEALVTGSESVVTGLTRRALMDGHAPMDIVESALMPGLQVIGKSYETGLCFVPELILAGRIMQSAMRLLEAEMRTQARSIPKLGTVVIGSVAGDIHTIGKDLVSTMLSLNGFEVHDLGFNVQASVFLSKVTEVKPDILALSALLTTAKESQRKVIAKLQEEGIRADVKVVVGGASTSREWAEEIGADGYAENASQAVQICRQMIR